MTRAILAAALAGAGLSLAACGYDEGEYNNADYNAESADYNAEGEAYGNGAGNAAYGNAAAASWPEGARIVEENGVIYRIDPGGARIALGPEDSRIVVENGARFRVDPDGTRVRIDDEGVAVRIDPDEVDTSVDIDADGDVSVNNNYGNCPAAPAVRGVDRRGRT